MKRYISIFSFLLGAFTAGHAFEVRADQTVYGGFCYFGTIYQPDEVDKYMSVDGGFMPVTLVRGGTAHCETNGVPLGMRLSDWGYVESQTFLSDVQVHGNLTWTGNKSGAYDFVNDDDKNSYAAIAVRFDYIKYNVAYDANGGTPKPDSVVNQPYNENFTLAAAPIKTGYTFAKWKASSNSELFGAGSSVNGSSLGLANCHVDGSNVTMTAQWATNVYSVACELVNGSWPADYAPPARAIYDTVFSLRAPTRTGYDFAGWKVTAGLDATTAKWGTAKNPATSIGADTLCANGDKDVYFKNLNPTDNAAVTLSAQWKPSTIRVTFNNDGGSSGGGVLSFLDVTYAAAYPAVDVPSKDGSLFRGYKINGSLYWDKSGQVQKQEWDIPTNCTAVAQWEAGDYELTYDENKGADSKQVRRKFEYDTPTELYDGADFSNLGCTLLGWSTSKQAEKPDDGCEIGGIKSFTESKTLYAVWEKNYFIAYDGNGATNETPMAVQKFVFGKSGQSLNPNMYGKVGYTFDGWATNRAAALLHDRKYKDREVITKDLATVVGETNTLYAIWDANTYYVAFDPNGGTGTAMEVWKRKYDQPVTLPEATYDHGAYDFIGWSNDVEKVVYTDLTKPVSNLCAVANATNILYAVWKLAPLSAAMHCDNLRWYSHAYEDDETYENEWRPKSNGEGVWQTGNDLTKQQWLMAKVPTIGTLSFKWKPVGCQGRYSLSYWITDDEDSYFAGCVDLEAKSNDWHSCIITKVPAKYYVHFYVSSTDVRSYCQIDQMTWTPGGPVPGPTDAVEISEMEFLDGKLILRFKSDADFDYNLLTNANLLIKEGWGVMSNVVGTGGTMYFEPKILEDQPQMFYKVETIQRK